MDKNKRLKNELIKLGSILKESTEADDFASQIESTIDPQDDKLITNIKNKND